MNIGKIINPFFLLPISIILVIWMYDWGWSMAFPELTTPTYLFFGIFTITLIFIGFLFYKWKFIRYNDIPKDLIENHSPFLVSCIIFGLFVLDVLYSGTIPALAGDIDGYEDFGMPLVDPLILSMITFFAIFWFNFYLTTKKKVYLLWIGFLIVMCLLMARRASLIYIFVGIMCLYLQKKEKVKIYVVLLVLVSLLGIAFLFGKMGEAKSGLRADYAVKWVGGSDKFIDSGVADEYYIPYLYAASPIANFQLTVQDPVRNDESFMGLVLCEYVPDFLSTKIKPALGYENYPQRGMERVLPTLNVGTYYVGGYIAYGWLGVVFNCVYMILFVFVVYKAYPKSSPYHTTINAFLCAIFMMTLFSNILRIFSVFFFFFIPILINMVRKYKLTIKFKK